MSIYADPHDSTVARYAPALLAAAATYPGDLVARLSGAQAGPGAPGPRDPEACIELAPPAAYLSNNTPAVDTWADSEPVVQVADPTAGTAWAGEPVPEWAVSGDPGDWSWPSQVTGITDAATAGRVAASLMRTLAGAR